MNCVVCGKKLKTPSSRNKIKIKIHDDCITKDIEIAIKNLLSPFLYKKEDGKLMKGYSHKPHEEL
jgi:hypothetical protein